MKLRKTVKSGLYVTQNLGSRIKSAKFCAFFRKNTQYLVEKY